MDGRFGLQCDFDDVVVVVVEDMVVSDGWAEQTVLDVMIISECR